MFLGLVYFLFIYIFSSLLLYIFFYFPLVYLFLCCFLFSDKPEQFTIPRHWKSKEEKKEWFFDHINEYLDQFVFDSTQLTDVAEQVQRLETNEKEGYPCRKPGCDQTCEFHSGRVRSKFFLFHFIIYH